VPQGSIPDVAYLPAAVALNASTATLIWQTTTGVGPDDTAVNTADQIFRAGTPNDPQPILVIVPSGTTLYICTAAATSTTGAVPIVGPFALTLNVVGNDSMYGIAASGTPDIYVLAGKV